MIEGWRLFWTVFTKPWPVFIGFVGTLWLAVLLGILTGSAVEQLVRWIVR